METNPPTAKTAFDPAAIKLIVYDLDGTLIDAFEDIQYALNAALEAEGLPTHSLFAVKGFVGFGLKELARKALAPGHQDRLEAVYKGTVYNYTERPAGTVHPYAGVIETLDRIRALGIKQAILTNKLHSVAVDVCDSLGLTPHVDGVWGEEEGIPLKPHPAAIERIFKHFNVAPGGCLMMGDGRADRDVARAAGTAFCGVTWGMHDRAQIEAFEPDLILDAMDELTEIFA